MKAVVYERYGAAAVLHSKDLPKPPPRAREICVRIRAVEVNKGDCELRSFRFPVKWFSPLLRPFWGIRRPRRSRRVLGGYFAGEVEACGAGVTRFRVGERVYGSAGLRMGAYAEYAVFAENSSIAPLPDTVDFAPAAASVLGGLNALHFLNLGRLSSGEHLLINGAGGSIGLAAIQIAKARGAAVTAIDKPEKAALLRSVGADHFIDYTREDFRTKEGARCDVLFNMVPSTTLADCLRSVKPDGRVLLGNARFADLLRAAAGRPTDGKCVHAAFAGETPAELAALSDLLTSGAFAPTVDRILPLTEAVTAHLLVEREERQGSIVLSPDA